MRIFFMLLAASVALAEGDFVDCWDYAPVCASDGQSYYNACAAEEAWVDVVHDGFCEAGDDTTFMWQCTNDADCVGGSICLDGSCVALAACQYDEDCYSYETCEAGWCIPL